MSDTSSEEEKVIEVIHEVEEIISSGDDPPMSEWSSLVIELPEENQKKARHALGLYSPGSGEICGKYIWMSDSDIFRHPYYNYPAVLDPGIQEALFTPEKPVIYPDDGQELYLAVCSEMNICPVRKFHRGLITDEINLRYYCVNPLGVRPMTLALQYNKTVRRLDLTDSFLTNDACYHLGQMLNTNSTIQELILAGCRIGAPGILRMGATLITNRSLLFLDISRCQLGERGGEYFAKQIADGAGIPRVNLSNNQLGRLTAMALTEALEYCNKLTHLDLSWNNLFHAPSVAKMLVGLTFSKVLQELNLAWNAMEGDRVAGQLKEMITKIPTLRVLNLSNNRFVDETAGIIFVGLLKAKKLSTLDLSFNPLSPEGAYHGLEKMTRTRVKLENLYLEGIVVEKEFLTLLDKVMRMKSRKHFQIKYGQVLHNWTVLGPDPRKVILERGEFLGKSNKKHKLDVGLFFLKIAKENPKPIPVKTLIDIKNWENAPLDDDYINELATVFAGPKTAKDKTVNVAAIGEYVNRLWPERRLPPTPPPEPEAELPPPPPPKGKKGKK